VKGAQYNNYRNNNSNGITLHPPCVRRCPVAVGHSAPPRGADVDQAPSSSTPSQTLLLQHQPGCGSSSPPRKQAAPLTQFRGRELAVGPVHQGRRRLD